MGFLKNLAETIREQQKERDEMDDEKTTDRYLRSLRRQRRVQLEEFEKEKLLKEIKAHELMRTRETVLGKRLNDDTSLIKKKRELGTILKAKQVMIPRKKPKNSFLGRGFI